MRCEWTLQAPAGYRLAVNFMEVDVHSQDCFYDKVTVYDGMHYLSCSSYLEIHSHRSKNEDKAKISSDH